MTQHEADMTHHKPDILFSYLSDSMHESVMQSIAAEMNLSETAFISLQEYDDNFNSSTVYHLPLFASLSVFRYVFLSVSS